MIQPNTDCPTLISRCLYIFFNVKYSVFFLFAIALNMRENQFVLKVKILFSTLKHNTKMTFVRWLRNLRDGCNGRVINVVQILK